LRWVIGSGTLCKRVNVAGKRQRQWRTEKKGDVSPTQLSSAKLPAQCCFRESDRPRGEIGERERERERENGVGGRGGKENDNGSQRGKRRRE